MRVAERGHASIETTERYLGRKQPLRNAVNGNKIHCSGKFTQSCLAIRQTPRPRFALNCENLTASRFECFWHPACKQRYNSTTFCAIRQDFSLKPARIVEFHDRPVADEYRCSDIAVSPLERIHSRLCITIDSRQEACKYFSCPRHVRLLVSQKRQILTSASSGPTLSSISVSTYPLLPCSKSQLQFGAQ